MVLPGPSRPLLKRSWMAGQGTCYTNHITFKMAAYGWGSTRTPTPSSGRVTFKIHVTRRGRGRLSTPVIHGVRRPHAGCCGHSHADPSHIFVKGVTTHMGRGSVPSVIIIPLRWAGGHDQFGVAVAPVTWWVAHATTSGRGMTQPNSPPIEPTVIRGGQGGVPRERRGRGVREHACSTCGYTRNRSGNLTESAGSIRGWPLPRNLWKPSFGGACRRGSGRTGVSPWVHTSRVWHLSTSEIGKWAIVTLIMHDIVMQYRYFMI